MTNPEEITEVIKERIAHFETKLNVDEVGENPNRRGRYCAGLWP